MIESMQAVAGLKIRAGDAWEESGFPEMMSTSRFYRAEPGDRLVLMDRAYKYNVATYDAKVEGRWIYTYDYSPNEAWVIYNGDLSGESYRQEEYRFAQRVYFRVCLRRMDGMAFEDEDINRILRFERRDTLRFALLTDTHYVLNGNWETTAGEIWAESRRRPFDGVIHLGDITDGMLSREICREYAGRVLDDLRAVGAPVWVALGNHDCNYFRGNAERLSLDDQCELYLEGRDPRYLVDFEAHRLRLLFLDSFDPEEKLRYGYSPRCIEWVRQTLETMPEGWNALIFSHLTPLTRLQAWTDRIRGEEELMGVLNAHAKRILAYINGHQHTDHLCNDEAFPILSIGCAKLECFHERKPPGSVTADRNGQDDTRTLWDVLTVDSAGKSITLERHGAGENRAVKNGRAVWR